MGLTNFSNVQLAEFQARLEGLWAEPQKSKNYQPFADSLKAVLEYQTAVLTPIEDPDIEHDFKVKFVDFAALTPATITQNDDCTNAKGTEGAGKTKTYALDYKKSVTFSVERDQLEKSFIGKDEIVATGLAQAIKSLIEDYNAGIPAVIEANRGDVVVGYAGPTGWTADIVGKEMEITTAQWNPELMIPQMMRVKRLLRNRGGIILDGGSLFNEYYKGMKTQVNSDGKTTAEMFGDIPYRHDLDGFAAATLTDSFYMIDPGTIAIANRAKYPALNRAQWTQGASGSYLRYSIPVSIPGFGSMMMINQGGLQRQNLMIDVQYSIVCDAGKELDTWKLILRAGTFTNPVRNLTGNTGILKFKKVA
jgi:hypothetical protein